MTDYAATHLGLADDAGMGASLASHGLSVYEVFNLFGPDWERRQLDKRPGRKL